VGEVGGGAEPPPPKTPFIQASGVSLGYKNLLFSFVNPNF